MQVADLPGRQSDHHQEHVSILPKIENMKKLIKYLHCQLIYLYDFVDCNMSFNTYNFAKKYAFKKHKSVNHKYDGLPYSVHLRMVNKYAVKYCYLLKTWNDAVVTEQGSWAHDLIEDCRLTYGDIVRILGVAVADSVYALSNNKGKTRAERANQKYYDGIKEKNVTVFLKNCDRLANIEYSIKSKSGMASKYASEHKKYRTELDIYPELSIMFNDMEAMFEQARLNYK